MDHNKATKVWVDHDKATKAWVDHDKATKARCAGGHEGHEDETYQLTGCEFSGANSSAKPSGIQCPTRRLRALRALPAKPAFVALS